MSHQPDPTPGYLTHVVRVRGVLVDVDGWDLEPTPIPQIKLTISIVQPSELAGVVYESGANISALDPSTEDIAARVGKGVYTFYGIDTPNVIGDSTRWSKDEGGPLQPGYVYSFSFCYMVDGQKYTETRTVLYNEEGRFLTPAEHTYTLAGLRQVVTRTLGANPGTDTATDIVNLALAEFFAAHEWSFAWADSMELDTRAGQPYIDLPPYFLRLRSIEKRNDMTHRMVKASVQEMRALRERAGTLSPFVTYYYIDSNPPRDLSEAPRPRLQIAPTPERTEAGVYVIDFERTPAALSNDWDIPPVPTGMMPLVRAFVRVVALESQNRASAAEERARLEQLTLPRFIALDARRHDTDNLGPLVGGPLVGDLSAGDPYRLIDPDVDLTIGD